MPRDRQDLLRLLEERLSTVSRWLAARRVAGERRLERIHAHLASVPHEMRKETKQSAHDALVRARATVGEMEREDQVPQLHGPLRREEIHALRHHLELTATLLPQLSNLDDPRWRSAHAEYERSWDELLRALDGSAVPTRGH